MTTALSARLKAVVDALPLRPGMRVLEIGCGPGAAARELAARVAPGYVVGIDRSRKAIRLAQLACADELAAKRLGLRCVAIEDFELAPGEAPFDLALAVRVGVLDGRHVGKQALALARIRAALARRGSLWLGDGAEMREWPL